MPNDVAAWISFANLVVLIGSIIYGIARFHHSIVSLRKEMESGIKGIRKDVDDLSGNHYGLKTQVDYLRGKLNGTNRKGS